MAPLKLEAVEAREHSKSRMMWQYWTGWPYYGKKRKKLRLEKIWSINFISNG